MASSAPKSRVRLSDIAQRLKINKATVSRALRNDRRISRAVCAQVQRVALQMGYRPDPMLAALAEYRRSGTPRPISAVLALVNYWPEPTKPRVCREFKLSWKAATAEAERTGYRLEEFRVGKDLTIPRLEKILLTRNINGILIPPHGNLWLTGEKFRWDEFCVVRFGDSMETPVTHLVSSDLLSNGLLAFENVWNKGYRRIGLVAVTRPADRPARFAAGFLYGQLNLPGKLRLPLLLLGKQDSEQRRQQQLVAWLKKTKPEAILTDVEVLRGMLATAGYRVPQDLGLATTSVLDGNADAGIYQNSDEIGKTAVQLLISLIHLNERGIPAIPREVLIKGRWVDGSTLPAR